MFYQIFFARNLQIKVIYNTDLEKLTFAGNKGKKGESQNGCFKKTKHAKFSEKRKFLTPWYADVYYQGVRNVHFSETLACFVFLKHLFWDPLFCLITEAFI